MSEKPPICHWHSVYPRLLAPHTVLRTHRHVVDLPRLWLPIIIHCKLQASGANSSVLICSFGLHIADFMIKTSCQHSWTCLCSLSFLQTCADQCLVVPDHVPFANCQSCTPGSCGLARPMLMPS